MQLLERHSKVGTKYGGEGPGTAHGATW
jgi:hypothetical protein